MEAYTFSRTANGTFETIVGRVKTSLAKEGFGILSDIDVKETPHE